VSNRPEANKARKTKLSIIVPTYNEAENIKPLIERIGETLRQNDYEVLVVDDNSPDGTAGMAESLSKAYPVRIIHRPGKSGLASAVVEGIGEAEGDIVGVIDADLQHPPELVAQLVEAVTEGNDIAIASRYVQGGGMENWSFLRKITSRGAILLSRPLTKAHDPVSGCFFLKKEVVTGIKYKPAGFKILLEILVKGKYKRIKEIPYTFRERAKGKSKLGLGEYTSYLKLLYSLYLFRLKAIFARK
jgi:dolichol-phosphate mannosyltransferase